MTVLELESTISEVKFILKGLNEQSSSNREKSELHDTSPEIIQAERWRGKQTTSKWSLSYHWDNIHIYSTFVLGVSEGEKKTINAGKKKLR